MRVEWKNAAGGGSGLFAANQEQMFSLVRTLLDNGMVRIEIDIAPGEVAWPGAGLPDDFTVLRADPVRLAEDAENLAIRRRLRPVVRTLGPDDPLPDAR